MLVINETAAGQTIDLPVGQMMELRLAENPTAGYRWQFDQDGGPSCRISEAPPPTPPMSPPASPPVPGAGTTHGWRIEGIAVGLCVIAMRYARPWEANRPPAMTLGVRIRVLP